MADDKLMATLCYSLIIAPIVLFKESKDKFAIFHAKQGVGFLIIFLVIRAIAGIFWIFWLPVLINGAAAVLLAYLAVEAMQGKKTKMPIVYDLGNWIATLFGK